MPRVSVLVPVFNAEAYLAEALRSVERQSYGDWEIVVADDASTDRSPEIAAGFGDRVRVVRNPVNGGVGAALALALAHATGELLAILAADDYWLPEYLEHQVALYDRAHALRGNVGIVACDALLLGPDGFLQGTYQGRVGFPDGVTLDELLRQNTIFGAAIVPRLVAEEAGGYVTERSCTEDVDLWFRILELGYRVVASREALYVYRLSPTSASANAEAMSRSKQETYRRALARGRLTPRQRRIVRRQLRFQRAIVANERIAAERRESGKPQYVRMARALPLFLLVVLEQPRRWPGLVRALRRGWRPGRRSMPERLRAAG